MQVKRRKPETIVSKLRQVDVSQSRQGDEGSSEAAQGKPICSLTVQLLGFAPNVPIHVGSDNFLEDRTHDGRKYRMLNIVDEFTRESQAIRIN